MIESYRKAVPPDPLRTTDPVCCVSTGLKRKLLPNIQIPAPTQRGVESHINSVLRQAHITRPKDQNYNTVNNNTNLQMQACLHGVQTTNKTLGTNIFICDFISDKYSTVHCVHNTHHLIYGRRTAYRNNDCVQFTFRIICDQST